MTCAGAQRAQQVRNAWTGTCQEVLEAHANAPHFHVCPTECEKRARGEPCACSRPSKLVITALLSLRLPQNSEASTSAVFPHVTHHPAPPPTPPHLTPPSAHTNAADRWIHTREMWHLMVSVINRMHTCNSLPHREPCCGFSGSDADGSHLVGADGPLWWLRTGYEHTHTDGDPLRVARRWTCWLLICSDQWFTTWSSVSGGPAPTELALWRWHAGQTSPSAPGREVLAAFFLWPCPLLLAQSNTKHFQTLFCSFCFTSMLLFVCLLITFISVDTFAGLYHFIPPP